MPTPVHWHERRYTDENNLVCNSLPCVLTVFFPTIIFPSSTPPIVTPDSPAHIPFDTTTTISAIVSSTVRIHRSFCVYVCVAKRVDTQHRHRSYAVAATPHPAGRRKTRTRAVVSKSSTIRTVALFFKSAATSAHAHKRRSRFSPAYVPKTITKQREPCTIYQFVIFFFCYSSSASVSSIFRLRLIARVVRVIAANGGRVIVVVIFNPPKHRRQQHNKNRSVLFRSPITHCTPIPTAVVCRNHTFASPSCVGVRM